MITRQELDALPSFKRLPNGDYTDGERFTINTQDSLAKSEAIACDLWIFDKEDPEISVFVCELHSIRELADLHFKIAGKDLPGHNQWYYVFHEDLYHGTEAELRDIIHELKGEGRSPEIKQLVHTHNKTEYLYDVIPMYCAVIRYQVQTFNPR